MSLNFTEPTFNIGGVGNPKLQFYDNGFDLLSGAEPEWRDIILSGNTALTLTGAKANGLNYVKLFGATEQSNLPSGYTQKEYISNGSVNNYNTKLDTGVMPEVGDVLEIIFTPLKTDTISNYLLQSRYGSNSTIFGISGSQSDASIMATWGGASVKAQTIVRQNNHKYYIKASFLSTGTTLYVKDLTTNEEETRTTELGEGEPTANYWLFGNRGGQTLQAVYHTYLVRITNGNRVKLHYLPAVHNTTEGFYDLVTNTLKQSDSGRFYASQKDATPSPDIPIDVKSNNGVLKVSGNLFDINRAVKGDISSADGGISTSVSYRIVSDFIPVSVGQSYTASGKICFEGNTNEYNVRLIIAFYDSNKGYISGSRTTSPLEFTIPDNGASYIRVEYWGDQAQGNTVDTERSKLQFELGTTATDYMPYGQIYTEGTTETVTDGLGNTATAEMLLAIGNYKDTQEILTGEVSKNVGIKVLDGTENWNYYSVEQGNLFRITIFDSVPESKYILGVLCNKYNVVNNRTNLTLSGTARNYDFINNNYSTLDTWKAYLADQYANGKPVIVIYPLATATTESVTGQTLTTKAGTNTITATGSLDNLGLEVSYKGL